MNTRRQTMNTEKSQNKQKLQPKKTSHKANNKPNTHKHNTNKDQTNKTQTKHKHDGHTKNIKPTTKHGKQLKLTK